MNPFRQRLFVKFMISYNLRFLDFDIQAKINHECSVMNGLTNLLQLSESHLTDLLQKISNLSAKDQEDLIYKISPARKR